jgi:hypothetical protein
VVAPHRGASTKVVRMPREVAADSELADEAVDAGIDAGVAAEAVGE